jgi:hypothetical protein
MACSRWSPGSDTDCGLQGDKEWGGSCQKLGAGLANVGRELQSGQARFLMTYERVNYLRLSVRPCLLLCWGGSKIW